MIIKLPSFALVCLVGISGSGKSTFARRHFQPTEILSSDHFRALIADDEGDQSVSAEAFSLLYSLAKARLKHKRLTVIDATSTVKSSRRTLLQIARRHQCPAYAVILDLPLPDCLNRNSSRPDRQTPEDVVSLQHEQLTASLPRLPDEGFKRIYFIRSAAELEKAQISLKSESDKPRPRRNRSGRRKKTASGLTPNQSPDQPPLNRPDPEAGQAGSLTEPARAEIPF
ncbi:MAG: AAA family ATPase [Deltaproteobacteria bacterium]|jgi:predicted kinase|nr:AAA family ATPase [Deltaproteobacteria bacterium]